MYENKDKKCHTVVLFKGAVQIELIWYVLCTILPRYYESVRGLYAIFYHWKVQIIMVPTICTTVS